MLQLSQSYEQENFHSSNKFLHLQLNPNNFIIKTRKFSAMQNVWGFLGRFEGLL